MNRIFQGFAQTHPFSRGVLIIDENLTAKILRPERSQAVKNHSPDGFNWGYTGSGPAQLALAMLLEVTNDEAKALAHYQDFKFQVIAGITSQTTNWEIEEQKIIAWLQAQETESL